MSKLDYERPLLKLIDDWKKYHRSLCSDRTTPPSIKKRRDSNKKAKSLKDKTHDMALIILKHLEAHKDVRVVNKFIESLQSKEMGESLTIWFLTFGKCQLNENNSKLKYDGAKKTNFSGAYHKPYWKFRSATQ